MTDSPDHLSTEAGNLPHGVPAGPPPEPPPGPVAESVALGFRALYVASALLALFWITSSVREIASDSQVVIRRFGRIVRTQRVGLVVAWPRPIENVQILPGPERQLSHDVSVLLAPSDKYRTVTGSASQGATVEGAYLAKDGNVVRYETAAGAGSQSTAGPGAYMTGDGNIVLLTANLIYRIDDPVAYALEEPHVGAALDRLFHATAVRITAGRNLNDFLVVQTNADQSDNGQGILIALRSEVRESFIKAMNDRLHALNADGIRLGVGIEKINLTPSLPPAAKAAFDMVLKATQDADTGVAMARTDAELRRQEANNLAERQVSAAEATAKETVSRATVDTATILALAHDERSSQSRESLILREYRARVANIMSRAGRVQLVDPSNGVILSGGQQ